LITQFMLAAGVALLGQPRSVAGSISGVVVNASQDGIPVGGAEVVLRVKLEGRFVTAAEGIADEQGRFLFDNIPADEAYIYQPGANREGIHYPGPRVRLNSRTPHARVKLSARDTISHPNPLILRRHEITIQPETDALRVTETMLIENPGSRTYVGRPAHEGGRAATLRLSIPSDFRRTTFDNEFYGRQFTLFDGRLVTDVPWTPGRRKLEFTYVLPNDSHDRTWQRPLDLLCDHLQLAVHTENPDEVACNLPRAASQSTGTVTFESTGETLPAGHVVRLRIDRLPVSLATYGRWLAVAVLVVLISTTGWIGRSSVARRLSAS
jgi:hypothetical protein